MTHVADIQADGTYLNNRAAIAGLIEQLQALNRGTSHLSSTGEQKKQIYLMGLLRIATASESAAAILQAEGAVAALAGSLSSPNSSEQHKLAALEVLIALAIYKAAAEQIQKDKILLYGSLHIYIFWLPSFAFAF